MNSRTSLSSSPVPRAPLPHQSDALAWAHRKDRVAFFLEMRLGKTLIAIRWAKAFKPLRVLIVCPLTVLPSWLDELSLEGIKGRSAREYQSWDDRRLWLVANWEMIRTRNLGSKQWDVVIADESTIIRNPKAEITKLFHRTVRAGAKAILSGYPAPEGIEDYWCQMAWLGDGKWMGYTNFWSWRNAYFRTDRMGWRWTPAHGTREALKLALAEDAFVLSRKAAKIGPGKVYQRRHIPLNADQSRLLHLAKHGFETDMQETKFAPVMLGWMHRISGGFHPDDLSLVNGAKIREVIKIASEELPKDRIVVWCWFRTEIEHIYKELARKFGRAAVAKINGMTSVDDRARYVREFRSGSIRILVCQVACARYGIDLSRGDTAIYYSNPLGSEPRVQSEDRIISPLKKDPCLYIDLVSGEVDENISDVLREKKAVSKSTLVAVIAERMGWTIRK